MDEQVIGAVLAVFRERMKVHVPLIAAIDGRCGSGKTTLAEAICREIPAGVIHMDHFFPQAHQRTAERFAEPGGNLDRERFAEEVLPALRRRDSAFSYRPFDCASLTLGGPIPVGPAPLILAEGTYSCRPEFRPAYDLTVFLTLSPEEQRRRILRRNGEQAAVNFREKWIPREERYFSAFDIPSACDIVIDTEMNEILRLP